MHRRAKVQDAIAFTQEAKQSTSRKAVKITGNVHENINAAAQKLRKNKGFPSLEILNPQSRIMTRSTQRQRRSPQTSMKHANLEEKTQKWSRKRKCRSKETSTQSHVYKLKMKSSSKVGKKKNAKSTPAYQRKKVMKRDINFGKESKRKAKTTKDIIKNETQENQDVDAINADVEEPSTDIKNCDTFLYKFDELKKFRNQEGSVYGISIFDDDFAWISLSCNTIKLIDNEGHVYKTFKTDVAAIFNSCTAEGDLLFSGGLIDDAQPIIYKISREESTINIFADISKYGSHVLGILSAACSRVFVIVKGEQNSLIELSSSGEILHCNNIPGELKDRVIEMKGLLRLIFAENGDIYSWTWTPPGAVKTNISRCSSGLHSGSTCVDNVSRLIIASSLPKNEILIFDQPLNLLHRLQVDATDRIISIAVDRRNRLWYGTQFGDVCVGNYLQNK